jgi:uncharacterized membrane protein
MSESNTLINIDSGFDKGFSIFAIIASIALIIFLIIDTIYMWRASRGNNALTGTAATIFFIINILMLIVFIILLILAIYSFAKKRLILVKKKNDTPNYRDMSGYTPSPGPNGEYVPRPPVGSPPAPPAEEGLYQPSAY